MPTGCSLYPLWFLLLLPFLGLFNGKRNTQVFRTTVDAGLNDDRTATARRTRLIRGREGIRAHFRQQNTVTRCYRRTASVFKPLYVGQVGRYIYFRFFAGA